MKKEGIHYLAYSLTLDPEEEIRGAIDEAKQGGLEVIVEEEKQGIEAAVAETPVLYHDNSASYKSDAVELPENYKDSGYRAADDDDDNVEVNYAFETDHAQREAEKTYIKEIDAQIVAKMFGLAYEVMYGTAEEMERVENYKQSLGNGVRFLLYDMRALNFSYS
jgi:hypothetical protein